MLISIIVVNNLWIIPVENRMPAVDKYPKTKRGKIFKEKP